MVVGGTAYFRGLERTSPHGGIEFGASVCGPPRCPAEPSSDHAGNDGHRVFVGIGKTLYTLDRRTGGILWQTVTNANTYSQINASPVVVGNLVGQGTAQFEEVVGKAPFSFRGSIGAFAASTGKLVWNFYTTSNNATSGAGEGIWSTPTVDKGLRLLFVGTGQNLDAPSGPLADSLLAIHYKTGTLAWSDIQFNHPDVFSTRPTFRQGGRRRGRLGESLEPPNGKAFVGVGSKNGTYYAMNRRNGRLVWEAHLAPGSTFGGTLRVGRRGRHPDNRLPRTSGTPLPTPPRTPRWSRHSTPRTGHVEWARHFAGNVFGPFSAVIGVAFVGTDKGTMTALDVFNGKTLWSYGAPGKVGGGASYRSWPSAVGLQL